MRVAGKGEFPNDSNHFCRTNPSGGLTQLAGSRPAAGFKPAERGPGGGLTATYCPHCEEPKKRNPSY